MGSLQFLIVEFPDHTHLLFWIFTVSLRMYPVSVGTSSFDDIAFNVCLDEKGPFLQCIFISVQHLASR